jgi:hypothetical protein
MLEGMQAREENQHKLAAALGKSYEDLRGKRTTEQGMLTLLWKAKTELYAQAVELQGERLPILDTNSGNILGTRLKERILAAINRRKGPVEKAIKLFNQRRTEYLKKYDPNRLNQPENADLTYAAFEKMDLDDPLWKDGHFYHARAPWATDPLVRSGIRSVLVLDRVEEEIELLTQELDRAITWAYEHHTSLKSTQSRLGMYY